MKKINVYYIDMPYSMVEYLEKLLSKRYEVVSTSDTKPDIIFASVFGRNILTYYDILCPIVLICGENTYPNYNMYDYSITCHDIDYDGRNIYVPQYAMDPSYDLLKNKRKNIDESLFDRNFCCSMIGNNLNSDPLREAILNYLSTNYEKVDNYGTVSHNVDYTPTTRDEHFVVNTEKIDILKKYKFNYAFENSNHEGYITEKLTEPFISNTIPIYWGGGNKVNEIFNKKAFIRVNDTDTVNELFEKIDIIHKNKDKYLEMLNEPIFNKKKMNWDNKILDFVDEILKKPRLIEHRFGNICLYNHIK